MNNIERAAEVLQVPIHWKADGTPKHWVVDQTDAELQARALVDQGLLVTDEQQRLIRLGEAVENFKANWNPLETFRTNHDLGVEYCLHTIYAEVGET